MVEGTPQVERTEPVFAGPHLRVLIANEKRERLELLAKVVTGLGHDVIARGMYVKEVGAVTAREHPDVALVGLGSSSEHALGLITEIVRDASCPVISILHAGDPAFIREAAKRGVFAYIIDGVETPPEELQSAIDITLQRFHEYQNLQGAFGRRAQIEQAKGILMARHSITAAQAFKDLEITPNTTDASSLTSQRQSLRATSCSYQHTSAPPVRLHPHGTGRSRVGASQRGRGPTAVGVEDAVPSSGGW